MTTIRWKDGRPLFLQPAPGSEFGLVAADQGCCCPPPPPERCWCEGSCSYFIAVVNPSPVATISPAGQCDARTQSVVSSSSVLQGIVPVTNPEQFPANLNRTSAASYNYGDVGGQLGAAVGSIINGSPDFSPPEAGNLFYAQADAGINIRCSYDGNGDPFYFAHITIGALAEFYTPDSPGVASISRWGRYFEGTLSIPATCLISPDRSCYPSTQEILRINAPLTITVNGDGTTSLGNLTLVVDGGAAFPDQGPHAEAAVDAIMGGLSYTFRITSRDNCLPVVDCDCESNTDGLKILFSEQPFFSFFLFDGDTELQTFSDLGAYYTLFYQPSANDWVITYEQNNPSNTELYYRITARIFCEAVPGGVPSPFRWYYSLESECFEWEDGSITKNTKETWVGHFNCEEDPCGTNGRAAGDLYPVGLPRDVVSLGRTTPEGYAACNPSGGIRELRNINDAECP